MAPVIRGGIIYLYGTGAGVTNRAGADGSILARPARAPVAAVSAPTGGQSEGACKRAVR